MKFDELLLQIKHTHSHLQQSAVKSVNIHISIRNWLVGYYIVEFEQNGEDRATYGTKLLEKIAKTIKIKGLTAPELSRCRQFYQIYNEFNATLFQKFRHILPVSILGSVTQESEAKAKNQIFGSSTQEFQTNNNQHIDSYYSKIFTQISFTHFVELIKIKDNTKRKFYELLIIKNTLSVRELERQIATLTYERVGLSENTELAFAELEQKITPSAPTDAVKSIYFFDFFDLPNKHLINENELEQALIAHLEQFILELGNGFCFEARQKRILIDERYYFVDLVFYHRILKCHILIDLKVDEFKHEHLSQLNSYVSAYRDQIKQADDNPPIGILLCTEKGSKMVEYALAGMEQKLFVSKYLLQLPSKEILSQFIENELKNK
jgi:predicted nuclease of restriction endonuclease-like (RecB) superfamily